MATSGLALVALIGFAALVIAELVAWAAGPRTTRSLGPLGVGLAITAAVTLIVVAVATLPVGDSVLLLALAATSIVLVAVVVVRPEGGPPLGP